MDKNGKRRWIGIGIGVFAVSLAAFLLYRTLSRYDFDELVASVTAIPAANLMTAMGFAAASYLCLTGFDWLALRYAGHALPYRTAALASFVSLSIGHNVGLAALSSGAVRYRFYSRAGLTAEKIARVILFCGLTVGVGLIVLAGIVLLARPDLAEAITRLSRPAVIALGVGCLGAAALYVALAYFLRAPLRIRSFVLEMPSVRLAAAQLLIGPLNFACVAACLYFIIAGVADVSYPAVAAVYILANVATIITHAPGGLGVIESVVLTLLQDPKLIGSVLAFRFVYFLAPLALGGALFALTEMRNAVAAPDAGQVTSSG
jgi:uncharacterized membrane protein YbhN (UPF0104 family)